MPVMFQVSTVGQDILISGDTVNIILRDLNDGVRFV